MQAVILAAGMGKRLKDLTRNNTKCMVEVNHVTLIDRMLHQLEKLHLSRIVIVVGYQGQKLIDYIQSLGIGTPISYISNPVYDKTNNIYSLMLAKEYLMKEDTILLESDLIFEDSVLQTLMEDPRETLALVDKYESWMDGTCIKVSQDDTIEAFIPGKQFVFEDISEYYKTVNIYKFSQHFSKTHYVPFLEAYSMALGNNEYYEQVLRVITMLDEPEIKAKRLDGQLWYEIDDIQDLDIASSMFSPNEEEKVSLIKARYGGYWRYPKLIDFCYLVNPYFPPQRLMDEMKANFETLLTQYPSGLAVNNLLASKNFGVSREHIIVGNGAAELIKCLMEDIEGKVGIVRPTFEEYPNRYDKDKTICFMPDNEDFSYTAEDLMQYFENKDISTLILINPDNPSGNYIDRESLEKFLVWCGNRKIRPVIDESFVDFADEEDNSLISEQIIGRFPNLVIIKSISKSYGVPGIRMGILVSGDTDLLAKIRKKVSIWNINSFCEFYMQIEEKYRSDYKKSLSRLSETRRKFCESLSGIAALRVVPSQANYLMVEITNGMTAKELTKILLIQYNLLIKDLSEKVDGKGRQYIRLAIRAEEDNQKLTEAFRKILS